MEGEGTAMEVSAPHTEETAAAVPQEEQQQQHQQQPEQEVMEEQQPPQQQEQQEGGEQQHQQLEQHQQQEQAATIAAAAAAAPTSMDQDPAAAAAVPPPAAPAATENGDAAPPPTNNAEGAAAPIPSTTTAAATTAASAYPPAKSHHQIAAEALGLGKHPNFRKLEPRVLLKYLEHHGLSAKADASADELAQLVARHFDREPVDEDQVLHSFFMSGMQAANSLGKFDKKRKRAGGAGGGGGGGYSSHHYGNAGRVGGGGGGGGKDGRVSGGGGGGGYTGGGKPPANADEEVAARMPNQMAEDATAGWILARIIKYVPDRDVYHVRDEDDDSNVLTMPSANVIRLHEENVMDVQKGDTVLAVFPDTTSFYRAQVTKVPKRGGNGLLEVMVKFDDDEDETGRTPHRRVPARHVLKLSQVGRYEGEEGSDGGSGRGVGSGGGGGGGKKGLKDYKIMISHALQKLPNSKGTLKEIFKIIENDFREDLQWKLEGDGKKTPVWKNQVRKLLVNPRSGFMFINAGERGGQQFYAEGGGGYQGQG